MTDLMRVVFRSPTDAIANVLVHLAGSERYGGQSLASMVALVELGVRTNGLVCIGTAGALHGVACWVPGSKEAQLDSYRNGGFQFMPQLADRADASFITLIHATNRRALQKLVRELKVANVGREVIWNRHNGAIRSLEPASRRFVAQL